MSVLRLLFTLDFLRRSLSGSLFGRHLEILEKNCKGSPRLGNFEGIFVDFGKVWREGEGLRERIKCRHLEFAWL